MIKMKLNIQLFAAYYTDEKTIDSQSATGSGGYRHKVILRYRFYVDPDNRQYRVECREQFYHKVTDGDWTNGSPYNRLLIDGTEKCKTTNSLGSPSGEGTFDLCPSFKGSTWQNMGTFSYDTNGNGNTHSIGVSCGYASSWAGISRKTTYHDITPPSINPANNILNSVANFNINDGFTPNMTSYGLNSYMAIANVTSGYSYAVSNGTSCKLTDTDKNTIITLLGSTNSIVLNFTLQTKNGDTEIGTSGPVQATCTVPVTTFSVTKDGSVQGKYNFARTNYGLYDTVTILYNGTTIRSESAYSDSITLSSTELTNIYNLMTSMSDNLTFRFKTYKNSSKNYTYQTIDKESNITIPDYSPTATLSSYSDSITTYNNYKNNATDIIAGLSKPTLVITLSNNYNNSYSQANVTCNGVTGTINERTVTFTGINQASNYKIDYTDSRGKSSSTTFTGSSYTSDIKTVPWVTPNISSIVITRPDGPVGTTAKAVITGSYYAGGNLKNLQNAILQAQYSFDETTWTDFTSVSSTNGSFNATFNLNGDVNFYKKPIFVRAKITDRIGISMSNWVSNNIPSGQPVFNTYRDNAGNGYMRINGKLNIDNNTDIAGILTTTGDTKVGGALYINGVKTIWYE